MRRLFITSCILAACSLVLFALSLMRINYMNGSRSTRVEFSHGALSIWACEPGDFSIQRPGLIVDPWSGWPSHWRPRFGFREPLWIMKSPESTLATQVVGANLLVPTWQPLVLMLLLAAGLGTWLNRREARRRRLGHCLRCGYDRRGIEPGGPCPECGSVREPPRLESA